MNTKEIKFRAKSTNTGKWVYGLFYYDWDSKGDLKPMIQHSLTGMETSFSKTVIEKETLGQFIGKLRTEEEVYINDIIQHGESIRIIEYRNGNTYAIRPNKTETILLSYCENPKLVGNIFDNPELLETKKAQLSEPRAE